MALTTIEKDLLRHAICDGALSNPQQNGQGQLMRGPITAAVLASVASMTDEQIKASLVLYKASKLQALNRQKDSINTQLANITNQLNELN